MREKFHHVFSCDRNGIQELIVGIGHGAAHVGGQLVRLDHAECRGVFALVHVVQPRAEAFFKRFALGNEFQILQTALCNDQLDVRHLACRGVTAELTDLGNIIILEPILKPSAEGAGLEEAVSEKHHALVFKFVVLKYADIQKPLAVPDDIFDFGFFFDGR